MRTRRLDPPRHHPAGLRSVFAFVGLLSAHGEPAPCSLHVTFVVAAVLHGLFNGTAQIPTFVATSQFVFCGVIVAGEMTRQTLADEVGVTRQTTIAIEAAKYAPSLELAFRIACTIGQPLEAVFAYTPPRSVARPR